MTLFDLSGKVVVVTGATKGIGRGIVERAAEHGARVIISSRKQAECDEVADMLNARYGAGRQIAYPIASDLRDLESLSALATRANALCGRIDVLVCNAAIMGFHGPSVQTPDAAFLDILTGNIFNYFKLCQMVAPQMQERRDGSIIFIGSAAAHQAIPNVLAYAVAKAGQAHMARNLAAELAPYNVRVNTIAPGSVRTEASKNLWLDPGAARKNPPNPLGRVGEPDDIAAAVIYLASAAGALVTGAVIPVDGGSVSLGKRDARGDAARNAAFAKTGGFSGDYKQD